MRPSTPTGVVSTTSGPVVGLVEDGLEVFRGIPFAAAPFGPHRFALPQPHEPWTQPFEAFRFGATAPQQEHAAPGGLPDVVEPIIPGADILNLNVWTNDTAGAKPVLVWMHGGGFLAGCSANPWYDGSSFARNGIVVVSFNYRLGAEGFMLLPDAPPNLGLRDAITALEWVRDNVGAFGGDPGRVTVMGQSAGGLAVGNLLVAEAARGLFAQAVMASGISDIGTWTTTRAGALTAAVAAELGVPATRAAMLDVDPQALVRAHAAIAAEAEASGAELMPPWAPVLDGDLVRQPFLDAVRDGHGRSVPVLAGTTRNEFAWLTFRDRPDDVDARQLGQRRYADELFREPTQRFAESRVATGAAPTYRYEFAWRSTAAPYIRAGHSIDIPFFFNTLAAPYVAGYTGANPPQAVADFDHAAFTAFVTSGDPGWPPFADGGAVMNIDTEPYLSAGLAA